VLVPGRYGRLERAGLVTRRVEETYPPSTLHAATPEAKRLQRILG